MEWCGLCSFWWAYAQACTSPYYFIFTHIQFVDSSGHHGRLNKRKQQLKRLAKAKQACRDKDEFGRKEEEEVTVFDGETTVDVDVDALGEDVVWQEEELEFEDVEEPGEDEAEHAQGRLEELRVQPESKRLARYVGNLERSKRRCCQKQRKAAVGTKKLTSFFAPVANSDNNNGDSSNEDDISKQRTQQGQGLFSLNP